MLVGNLSIKYVKAINANRVDIIEDLMVADIISDLRTSKSFELEDVERINHEITSKDKASLLLDTILNKDDECFERFHELLGPTYEHLAEGLTASMNNTRTRRMSGTVFGELLIKGGVPERLVDYIRRKDIEDAILTELMSNKLKPIVVHGAVGCGKSCIVGHVLYSEEIFPHRYSGVCWMMIGNIKEGEVLTKLTTLLGKLDLRSPDPSSENPDLCKERISEKLRQKSILLILDDVWDSKIMKYFTFPLQYIITSRQSSLFTEDQAKLIEVPDKFEYDQCLRYLENCDQSPEQKKKIIDQSQCNPLYLSLIKNLLKSNRDYSNIIGELNLDDLPISKIIQANLTILPDGERRCYEMLAILNEDEAVSLNLLSVYWNEKKNIALKYLSYFRDNHLMTMKWSEEYKCNMYGIHDMHWKYLVDHRADLSDFKQKFIENHVNTYKDWLKFDHLDPYFFMSCARILHSIEDIDSLRTLFTDLTFLAAKIVISGISDLLFDFETYCPKSDAKLWSELERFFMRHNHRFENLPANNLNIKIDKVFFTIIQLSLFEGKDNSQIFSLANSYKDRSRRNDFWAWDNAEPSMKIWEASHVDVIDLIDINQCAILMTTEDGRLSLCELKNGKSLFNYKISDEKIIVCKFLEKNSLEFIMIEKIKEKSARVRHFDISNLLNYPASPRIDDVDDDFTEFPFENEDPAIDFQSLRRIFRRTLIQDFIAKCQKSDVKLKSGRIYDTGSVVTGSDVIFVASSEEHSRSTLPTLIDCYFKDQISLSYGYPTQHQVKKILHTCDFSDRYYFLDNNGVHFVNDVEEEIDKFTSDNEVIYDFIVVGNDVYRAAGCCVYKNNDETPILTTVSNAHITHLSMCPKSRLMALCLTNRSVQIWDIVDTKLLYSLKGFDCTGAYFEFNGNNLITTAQRNVSKWSLDSLKPRKRSEESDNLNYRYKFHMHAYSPNNVIWITQKYNDEIEFKTYVDNVYSSRLLQASSKATCFAVEGKLAIIGFLNSKIQIYDLSHLSHVSCVKTIDSVKNVIELSTRSVDDGHWEAIVHYNGNKIKGLLVTVSDLSVREFEVVLNVSAFSKLRLFKMEDNDFLVGVCVNNTCSLHSVNRRFEMAPMCSRSLEEGCDISDFDVSADGRLVCVASSTGVVKVWSTEGDLSWQEATEGRVVSTCRLRPGPGGEWGLVASLADDGTVRLLYFKGKEKTAMAVVEDHARPSVDQFRSLAWSQGGEFLIVGDGDIKKWKINTRPTKTAEIRYPLTRLYTYAGGLRCLQLSDSFICTIDLGGYFYIFRKV